MIRKDTYLGRSIINWMNGVVLEDALPFDDGLGVLLSGRDAETLLYGKPHSNPVTHCFNNFGDDFL